MDDLISRQAAIDAIKKAIWEKQVAKDAIDCVCNVPSAQRWIPVSERPPEFPCICCDANGNTPFVPCGIVTVTRRGRTFCVDAKWFDFRDTKVDGQGADFMIWENRIVAWMPLPEPYREEEKDENH